MITKKIIAVLEKEEFHDLLFNAFGISLLVTIIFLMARLCCWLIYEEYYILSALCFFIIIFILIVGFSFLEMYSGV